MGGQVEGPRFRSGRIWHKQQVSFKPRRFRADAVGQEVAPLAVRAKCKAQDVGRLSGAKEVAPFQAHNMRPAVLSAA